MICSDPLHCLRKLWLIVIITESGWNCLKVLFTEQSLTKDIIFRCFDVFSVRPPQIFWVQAKISTIRPMFLDYFYVSYFNVSIILKHWTLIEDLELTSLTLLFFIPLMHLFWTKLFAFLCKRAIYIRPQNMMHFSERSSVLRHKTV